MEQMNVNGKTYNVLKLLGKGKGGYSYLVTDGAVEYVLKQIHHEPCDYYQFGDKLQSELRDYQRLRDVGIRMPELFEVDEPQERILKQYIPGLTIAQLGECNGIRANHLDQVREMSVILREAGLNIDYYPTNFVVWDEKLYYIDYECNTYMDQWNYENWGIGYWVNAEDQR